LCLRWLASDARLRRQRTRTLAHTYVEASFIYYERSALIINAAHQQINDASLLLLASSGARSTSRARDTGHARNCAAGSTGSGSDGAPPESPQGPAAPPHAAAVHVRVCMERHRTCVLIHHTRLHTRAAAPHPRFHTCLRQRAWVHCPPHTRRSRHSTPAYAARQAWHARTRQAREGRCCGSESKAKVRTTGGMKTGQ
jgi:hypothetical protein